MRAQADVHPSDDWILHALSELCLGQGRPADGLAHLDALDVQRGGETEWELYWMRLPLTAACSGVDEAVERARAHTEGQEERDGFGQADNRATSSSLMSDGAVRGGPGGR
ncbi:hypothetical protein [Streptomyces sp. NPDC006971]|uniref:hypothetical protein n=1 Tax=Streptomyces sp. NPDC006971 TaxID=3154784 RepID=UPI0033D136CE